MSPDTRPGRWNTDSSGWGNTLLLAIGAVVGVAAPIVFILALAFGWGTVTLIVSAALTVLIWGGIALLLGPLVRRVQRKQESAVPTEVGKLPALAQQYGLSFLDSSEELAGTLARRWTSRGRCTSVLSGRIGGHPAAICWYDRTEGGTELASLVLVMALPAAMPRLQLEPKLATVIAPGTHRQQVQFEDDTFNNRYDVIPADHSPDSARYAVDVISQRAIDWLLSVKPFFFDITGELICVDGISVLAADEVQNLLNQAIILGHLIDAVPEFAWTQYGSTPDRLPGLD